MTLDPKRLRNTIAALERSAQGAARMGSRASSYSGGLIIDVLAWTPAAARCFPGREPLARLGHADAL